MSEEGLAKVTVNPLDSLPHTHIVMCTCLTMSIYMYKYTVDKISKYGTPCRFMRTG